MDVKAAELGVLLEAEQAVAAVALEVEHLEHREELHALKLIETLKVEVELLVELKGAVVVLPILAEEGQEPLLCDL